MGHFIPCLELAKKFVIHHHFTATILIFPDLGPKWSAVQQSYLQPDQLPFGLSYLLLPQPDFSDLPTNMKHEILGMLAVSRSLASIRDILTDLSSSEKLKIVALVVDLFGDEAIDIAREFEISPYLFFTMNAMALSSILHLPKLDQRVSCEYGELLEPIRLPGCIPLPGKDVPEPLLNRQSFQYKAFVQSVKKYQTVDGIIVNTFQELEPGALKGLQEEDTEFFDNIPLIYTIGPLVQSNSNDYHDAKESVLINWLGTQPLNSVLYICFGSHWTLSQAQMNELAFGLETSETRFLWVVRLPKDENGSIGDDPLGFLPKGFIERTKEQGLIVPNWTSQQKILMHEAIGGFITHCGWNFTLESIVNGVPMIAWPQGAEQKMNALVLTEDVKVAIKVKSLEDDIGLVERGEIAETVKNLMGGEEGKEVRDRVRELKRTAKNGPP